MAPPILSYENLGLHQGEGWLFKGIDVHVGPRDRLALIGRNGAGKTTLLKCLAGTIETDLGKRMIVPGTRVVLLEQDPVMTAFATLEEWVLAGEDAPEPHEAAAIADQIGIDLARPTATASGGERRRAAIVRALAQNPDVLLLDEPTNHLDLGAIDWLEQYLMRFKGAFIVISHDRTFLARLTKSCIWLDRGNLRRAEIGFGGFDAWTEAVYAEEERAADKLDAKLKLELHWLQRGVTARRKRNQGRLAKLHEMRASRAAMLGPAGAAKLGLARDDVKTKVVIDAEHVTKSFPNTARPELVEGRPSTSSGRAVLEEESRLIIRDFSLRITRGDRIGLVGANGTGKTTLLKLLTGELAPDSGKVTKAKSLNGIVIDQQRKLMSPEKRVRDVLAEGGDWIDVRGVKKHIKGYLKEYLFAPELTEASVGTLSGGERSRLLLAREFARASNLLVLDEPTNDLDLETLDLLQEVIADYDGTVLIVSHDRDFLDKTVTVTLGLDGSGTVDVVAGGYEDWVKRKSSNPPRDGEGDRAKRGGGGSPPAPPHHHPADGPPPRAGEDRRKKLSYKDQRDLDRLPGEVERLEREIAATEDLLHDPDLYAKSPAKFDELTRKASVLRDEKDAAEHRWLEVAELAEQMAAAR